MKKTPKVSILVFMQAMGLTQQTIFQSIQYSQYLKNYFLKENHPLTKKEALLSLYFETHPKKDKTLVDTIIVRSCTFYNENSNVLLPSYGTVDIVRNHRIMATNITYRNSRIDPQVAFIKHEVIYSNKWLNPLLGIQFNKSNDGNIPEGNMRYTLEYVQKMHEREIQKFEKQKLGRVIVKDEKNELYLCLEEEEEIVVKEEPIVKEEPLIKKEEKIQPIVILEEEENSKKPSSIQVIPIETKAIKTPTYTQPQQTPQTISKASIDNKRKNFSIETKFEVLKKQQCRDTYLDFRLNDEILPLDFDHKDGRTNNSRDNCQVLSVISHALKTRKPELWEQHIKEPNNYIVELLNCITCSKHFIDAYKNKQIRIKKSDEDLRDGIFFI
jgi:hypothetical protein